VCRRIYRAALAEVLEHWQIDVPVVAFDVNLSQLSDLS
jgi:hypothetical protein